MNTAWRNREVRVKILRAIREVFWSWGFVEVDTPLLVARPGQEPFLNPFETTMNTVDGRAYTGHLITSPEYALKKLLARAATGEAPSFNKIFQLAHVFRNNEDFGGTHNPEFMMIEWYHLNKNYETLMTDVEELVCSLVHMSGRRRDFLSFDGIAEKNFFDYTLTYGGREINLARPWQRITVADAFKMFANRIDTFELADNVEEFYKVFFNEVEPKIRALNYPVHLIEYPAQMAALARKKPGDSRVAERVETYIAGLELTNGFSELTDAAEQRQRFLAEQRERAVAGKKPFLLDEEFLAALPYIPSAAGISLGVDRLIMLLLDAADINDVLFWPAADLFAE